MDQKLLEKIGKLLALGESSEPHEAALAMQKARELMETYQVSQVHVAASQLREKVVAGPRARVKAYEAKLERVIERVFSVKIFRLPDHQALLFVGDSINIEVAAYAYTVAYRKLEKDRAAFIDTLHPRMKRANKTKAGDDFAYGWTYAVAQNMQHLSSTLEAEKVAAWAALKNATITEAKSMDGDRLAKGRYNPDAIRKGAIAGKNTTFEKPVAAATQANQLTAG